MAFQIKDFISVTAGILNAMRASTNKITDFQVGSVARTLIEAPAVEIEELYQQMFIGLREAIPVATFLSFGFDKKAAAYASGRITLVSTPVSAQDFPIPAGTVFTSVDGRQYVTLQTVVWPAGVERFDVQVRAVEVGLSGNISQGQIITSPILSGRDDVTIEHGGIDNGRDEETDEEREARFADFIQSLSRGTREAIRYAILQAEIKNAAGVVAEYVTRLGIDEKPGHVKLYIYANTGRPSDALLLDGQRRIDGYKDDATGLMVAGYRALGVRVDVLAMGEKKVPFAGYVGMLPNLSLTNEVRVALEDAYRRVVSAVPSGDVLYVEKIVEAMLAVPGVRKVIPFNTENILCDVNEVLIPDIFDIDPIPNP